MFSQMFLMTDFFVLLSKIETSEALEGHEVYFCFFFNFCIDYIDDIIYVHRES